jgi:metabolite-proton symporter
VTVSDSIRQRRAALASLVGTTIEWYDYFIFGTAAAIVFDQVFFPDLSPTAGTLASFASFAVGFLARPLGTILFSHFGDRRGRKPVMIATLLLTGISTVLIALLPGYDTIGLWAPVLLVTMRILQGIGAGGEWGGAALVATEHAPAKRRGLYGSAPMVGVPLGTLLSSGVFALVTTFTTEEQFVSWGWRLPFILSGALIVFGLVLRTYLTEAPVYAEEKVTGTEKPRIPLVSVLRHQWRTVLLAVGGLLPAQAAFYVSATWVVSYATKNLHYDRGTVLNVITCVAALGIVAKVAAGSLSDRIGRRRVLLAGNIGLGVVVFAYFWLINQQAVAALAAAFVLMELVRSLATGPVSAFFAELFETNVRYTGVSISYQTASIFGGGLAPLICSSLLLWTGTYWAIAGYMAFLVVIAVGCLLTLRETSGRDLGSSNAQPATAHGLHTASQP